MKRGSTATISIVRFRAAWTDHTPIADLCTMFTITKDQVIRLRDVWHLPKRHDRRMPERAVGRARHRSESILPDRPLDKRPHDLAGSICIGQARQSRDISCRPARQGIGNIQAAIAGESGKQRIGEGQDGRSAPGGNVLQVS